MRSCRGRGEHVGDPIGLPGIDDDDDGRIGDIDVEGRGVGIEHRPARAARHRDLGAHGAVADIHHRDGMRAGEGGIADIEPRGVVRTPRPVLDAGAGTLAWGRRRPAGAELGQHPHAHPVGRRRDRDLPVQDGDAPRTARQFCGQYRLFAGRQHVVG